MGDLVVPEYPIQPSMDPDLDQSRTLTQLYDNALASRDSHGVSSPI